MFFHFISFHFISFHFIFLVISYLKKTSVNSRLEIKNNWAYIPRSLEKRSPLTLASRATLSSLCGLIGSSPASSTGLSEMQILGPCAGTRSTNSGGGVGPPGESQRLKFGTRWTGGAWTDREMQAHELTVSLFPGDSWVG